MPSTARGRPRRRWARCSVTIAVACALWSLAPEARAADEQPATAKEQGETNEEQPGSGRLSRYLTRTVRPGPRFVDHGVLQATIAGGWPHLYRIGLSLGVLDHITLGATAHWVPGQSAPRWSPDIAIAFYRGRNLEVGAWHMWSLYPPPVDDFDPETPSFQREAQWLLGTMSFGQAALTAGLDIGTVRERVNDPGMDANDDSTNPSIVRWRFGGGMHLRAGTRRWGFTAQVLVPQVMAEIRFDIRFGLFEMRQKGGWKLRRSIPDWDRPLG